MKFKKHYQTGETTCIVHGCRGFVDTCNFTNKDNSQTPKVELHTRQKLCYFCRYVAKANLFCVKSYVPVTRAVMFIWENFDLGY